MLGSEGRECVQVVCRRQDATVRMKVPTLASHTLTATPTTTTTLTLHKQRYEGGTCSQRGPLHSHETVVVSPMCGSPQGQQGAARHLTLTTTTAEGAGTETVGGGQSGGDDLTSLSWLHSLDMGGMVPHLAMTPPTPPASPQPHNPLHPLLPAHAPPMDRKRKVEVPEKVERIDYSKDGSKKPPYSYAALIGMAMKENQNKMTLSAIYKWIKENFAYYKTADPSWQNSIRHNLSLNKCFLKVARSKDEPGKGGFWRLDPEYADALVDGVFKKRRPTRTTLPPPTKSKKSRRPPTQQQMQQQIQQLGIKVVVQPQTAFMPPPTNKPPPRSTIYLSQNGPEVDSEVGDNGSNLRDDLVWSTLLGEEVTDDTWPCQTQELVTDLSQTGDPSTYPTTVPTTTTTLIPHPHLTHNPSNQHFQISEHQQPQVITITTSGSSNSSSTPPSLPSLELSPASLGVEEELFTSPEYSEASNDDADSLTSSLEMNNGGWSKAGYGEQLPSMNTLCSSLTPLAPMEPTPIIPTAAPVLVQDAHAYWGTDSNWDEKTLPLLDANLDLENLIDLDVVDQDYNC